MKAEKNQKALLAIKFKGNCTSNYVYRGAD